MRARSSDRRVHVAVRGALVTVRVTTLKGPDVGLYYLDSIGRYYLDATGEPAGVWHGRGLDRLGVDGAIADDAFLRLMAGQHPTTGATLGRAYTSRLGARLRPHRIGAEVRQRPVGARRRHHPRRGGRIHEHDRAVAAMVARA